MEGWAQANQGTPAAELAVIAWDDQEKGPSLTFPQLVAPDWYWYSGPAAYNQGAPPPTTSSGCTGPRDC
jgi:hypothetical protein